MSASPTKNTTPPKGKSVKKEPHAKGHSRRFLIAGVLVLVVGNLLLWSVLGFNRAYAHKLLPGTAVNGQLLSGMTRPQAQETLVDYYTNFLNRDVTLQVDDMTKITTLSQLGFEADIQTALNALFDTPTPWYGRLLSLLNPTRESNDIAVLKFNQGVFDAAYPTIEKELSRESNDSALELKNGQLVTAPPQIGATLNKGAVATAIQSQGEEDQTIILPFTENQPELASETQLAAAKKALQPLVAQPLVLTIDGTNVSLTPDDVFAFIIFTVEDKSLTYTFNEAGIKTKLTELSKKTDVKAATKTIMSTDNSVISEGKDGKKLNIAAASAVVLKNLKAGTVTQPIVLTSDTVARNVVVQTPEFQLGRYPGKYIEIDLSSQSLYIMQGEVFGRRFGVSTGKWSTPTPIGEFTILNHMPVAWSSKFALYMPWWMAIKPVGGAYDGYGIHGLPYWPSGYVEGTNHIGTPVSHGCIRLGPGDEKFLYDWAENGIPVVIHQ